MNFCQNPNCNKQTNNPKYCSRKCSTTVNNKLIPKREKQTFCKVCNQPIQTSRKYCEIHRTRKGIQYGTLTIASVIYTKHHKSSAYAFIRTDARRIMKNELQVCAICSYSKHVEVCHIKPIKSFPLDTLVRTVNAKENLKLLCPNCHWEHDSLNP